MQSAPQWRSVPSLPPPPDRAPDDVVWPREKAGAGAAVEYTPRQAWGVGLLERYRAAEQIGEGTYGQVFKAEDAVTGEQVALKKMTRHHENEGVRGRVLVLPVWLRERVLVLPQRGDGGCQERRVPGSSGTNDAEPDVGPLRSLSHAAAHWQRCAGTCLATHATAPTLPLLLPPSRSSRALRRARSRSSLARGTRTWCSSRRLCLA